MHAGGAGEPPVQRPGGSLLPLTQASLQPRPLQPPRPLPPQAHDHLLLQQLHPPPQRLPVQSGMPHHHPLPQQHQPPARRRNALRCNRGCDLHPGRPGSQAGTPPVVAQTLGPALVPPADGALDAFRASTSRPIQTLVIWGSNFGCRLH